MAWNHMDYNICPRCGKRNYTPWQTFHQSCLDYQHPEDDFKNFDFRGFNAACDKAYRECRERLAKTVRSVQ